MNGRKGRVAKLLDDADLAGRPCEWEPLRCEWVRRPWHAELVAAVRGRAVELNLTETQVLLLADALLIRAIMKVSSMAASDLAAMFESWFK